MSIEIEGKTILVTGANRGIGRSIVETFLEHGATKVYLGVRDLDSTKELVAKYENKVVPLHVDLSDQKSIEVAAQLATDVQLLVNNAGVLTATDPLDDNAEESLHFELDVNTFGLLRIAQAFTPILEQNKQGVIVQINSVASIKNFSNCSTYSVSKAASYSLTQGLRSSLKARGIGVLSVHPGPIATEMANDAGAAEIAEPASVVSEGIIQALKDGKFHLFPDTLAKEMGAAYSDFARSMIEA